MITITMTNSELTDIKKHPSNGKLFTAMAKSHKRYKTGGETKESYQSMTIRFLEFHGKQIERTDKHTVSGELIYDSSMQSQVVNVASIAREFLNE